jgi:hypothetical protein
MPRDTSGYRHGLRVRMGGPGGPRGVLFECESRVGRKYWKVRLQTLDQSGARLQASHTWVFPDKLGGIVVDGPADGDAVEICASCGLRFIHHRGDGELICERCDAEQFGTAVRSTEPPPVKRFGDDRPRRRR